MTRTPADDSDEKLIDALDHVDDGARVVSLTFTVTLYTGATLSETPEAVLGCFDRFLHLCPAEQIKYYATENMLLHKPVNRRTFGMLKTWLKPGAPPREFIALELIDGEAYNWAPKFKFRVWGNEPESLTFGEDGNFIHMAFPPEWGLQRPDEMAQLLRDLAEDFPYRSGLAGFGFQCSRYDKWESEDYAWARSMRHRGIDIFIHPYDTKAVGHDAIKGVNWLTLLDDAFVKRLGGKKRLREALPDAVEVTDVPRGVLIKAGPLPRLGDTNRRRFLPEYKEVYKVVAPLAEPGYDRTIMFLAGRSDDDYEDNTRAWQRRFV
jgi:hypothetical protein